MIFFKSHGSENNTIDVPLPLLEALKYPQKDLLPFKHELIRHRVDVRRGTVGETSMDVTPLRTGFIGAGGFRQAYALPGSALRPD